MKNIDLYNNEDVITFKLYDDVLRIRGLGVERLNNKLSSVYLLIEHDEKQRFIHYLDVSSDVFEEVVGNSLCEIKIGNYNYIKQLGDKIAIKEPNFVKMLLKNSIDKELNYEL